METNNTTANLTIVLDKEFWTVYHNEQDRIFEAVWHDKGREMEDEEFRQYISEFAALFKDYPTVRGFMVDTRAYHFMMVEEIQEWHDQFIIPQYIEAKLEKIAFIMSEEFIVSISIEQAFDEEIAQAEKTFDLVSFSNPEDARAWIVE